MFLAGQEVKNPLASKFASAFWPFDPGIISYYYKKSCFSNIIRVCWWYLTPYIKKREIPMYLPLSSKYTFLRWHYPNQVYGSKFWTSSQPVKQAPRFIYKIQYSSVGKKCQYQYKNIFGHILESHIPESDAGVTDKLYINCILQECFREAVICFCNAEYGKMHKKNRAYSKKSCERAEIAENPLTNAL